VANADRIAFVDPIREVRNQIVHDGGEANPFKSGTSFDDLGKGDDAYLNTSFSKKYPQFASGSSMFAEVSVDEGQLQSMVDSALALVDWLATELRKQEEECIASIKPGSWALKLAATSGAGLRAHRESEASAAGRRAGQAPGVRQAPTSPHPRRQRSG
jgi:hypothetical protein